MVRDVFIEEIVKRKRAIGLAKNRSDSFYCVWDWPPDFSF